MDKTILEKIDQKIRESRAGRDEIRKLAGIFPGADPESVGLGITVGRLYNAFYYQSRRMLNRDPTELEFEEFVKYLRDNRSKLG